MNKGKYLLKNTIIFAIGSMGSKLINFILVPIYTGVLNSAEYGIIDLVFTIGTVLVPILTFNISESIMRFALDKNEDENSIITIGLVCLLISTILSVIIIPICNFFDLIYEYKYYVYFYCITAGYSQIFLACLRGKERLFAYSIGNIINTFIIASLNILLLIIFKMGVKGFLLSYIISNIITSIYSFILGNVKNNIRNLNINKILFNDMVKYSIALIPNSFMWWIMNSSDRLMITSIIGVAANGILAIAYKIPTILSTFTNIFTVAWSYSAIKEDKSEDKEAYNNYIYDRMVKTIIILAVGILCILKPFLKIYVANEYFISWKYTSLLLIGFVFMTLGSFVATSYTVYKDSIGFLKSGIIGAITNIVLNIILIKRLDIYGAVIATIISYIVVYIYRVIDTKKYLKLKVINKKHLLLYCILITATITINIDKNYGSLLIWGEFIILIIILRKDILEIVLPILNKILKKLFKSESI